MHGYDYDYAVSTGKATSFTYGRNDDDDGDERRGRDSPRGGGSMDGVDADDLERLKVEMELDDMTIDMDWVRRTHIEPQRAARRQENDERMKADTMKERLERLYDRTVALTREVQAESERTSKEVRTDALLHYETSSKLEEAWIMKREFDFWFKIGELENLFKERDDIKRQEFDAYFWYKRYHNERDTTLDADFILPKVWKAKEAAQREWRKGYQQALSQIRRQQGIADPAKKGKGGCCTVS